MTSTRAAKEAHNQTTTPAQDEDLFTDLPVEEVVVEPVAAPEPLPENVFPPTGEGGLAAAIARSRLIKQEKEKTLREKSKEQQIKRI
jgi:hypothetical protein